MNEEDDESEIIEKECLIRELLQSAPLDYPLPQPVKTYVERANKVLNFGSFSIPMTVFDSNWVANQMPNVYLDWSTVPL